MIIEMISSSAFSRASPELRSAIMLVHARAFLKEFAEAALGEYNSNFRKRTFDYEVYP